MIEPCLVVHGGAGAISEDREVPHLNGVKRAAKIGYKVLIESGNVIDAVEAAVRDMEDDPVFNAGLGSVLNLDGEVEMDASIMEGTNLSSGCLGVVKDIKNPISLARLVMEKTPHVLLVGEGARRFAIENGIEILPPGALVTERSREALKKRIEEQGGTVGAVAVDRNGHVAVATSTGGYIAKMVGRVGDTAVIGSGSYADDNVGAVSTTGHGDTIMKYCLAHAIIKSVADIKDAQDATQGTIDDMVASLGNYAGAITITNKGEVGIGFSSKGMSWAYQRGNILHYGVRHFQDFTENVN